MSEAVATNPVSGVLADWQLGDVLADLVAADAAFQIDKRTTLFG
jgi:hypothetical protein